MSEKRLGILSSPFLGLHAFAVSHHDVPSSLNEGPLSTCFDRKRTGR